MSQILVRGIGLLEKAESDARVSGEQMAKNHRRLARSADRRSSDS